MDQAHTDPIGFLAFGHAVPSRTRTASDPDYDALRAAMPSAGASAELFRAAPAHHCLAAGERLEDVIAAAAREALERARVPASAVDRVYGCATFGEYLLPSGLFAVHQALGLDARTMVVPVESAFTNFVTSAVLGWEAILARRARYVLVACGSGLSRNMDYAKPESLFVGDGAGAAVLGPGAPYAIVDAATSTWTDDEGYRGFTMGIAGGGARGEEPAPRYRISEAGIETLRRRGLQEPPRLLAGLLEKHGIASSRVALVTHHAPAPVVQAWADAVRPAELVSTADRFGDATMAAVPMTLATRGDALTADYVAMIAVGMGAHYAVLLVERRGRA